MKYTVQMKDTDASQRLYFTSPFDWCQAAFEEHLLEKGCSLQKLLQGEYHAPVIYVEGSYKKPLTVSDSVVVRIANIELEDKTVSLQYEIFDAQNNLAFIGKVVHCCVEVATGQACSLPAHIKKLFS